MSMIWGKMFLIFIFAIKAEILFSKKLIQNDITCWQENLSASPHCTGSETDTSVGVLVETFVIAVIFTI